MRELFGLEGKRILVLGGGQGMGEATVLLLAKLGAHVAIADLEFARAERVAAAVGPTAMPIAVDVLDDAALIEAVVRIGREFGPLDGMATVIGMAAWSALTELELDTWDLDHRRNLRYFFIAAREVAKSLIARGSPGAIVCTASVDGSRSAPFHASYGAAKAGLSNLVKTMTVEWGRHGIRANVVAPGAIITPRIPHMGDGEALMTERIPMLRRGSVQEIADAIVFLLSDMARYISGQTLAVDGGFLAQYPFDLTPRTPAQGTIGA